MVIDLPEPLRKINTTDINNRDDNSVNENSLQFSVYGSIIPEVRIPEIVERYAGQSYKGSTHVREPYPNISVNFTIDNKFNNYWVIHKWLDILNNDKESVFDSDNISETPNIALAERNKTKSPVPPTLYQANITIYGKDEFDKNVIKFVYTNAFPVGLGKIDYNYRTENELETTFEFAFSQLLIDLI